MPNGAPSVIVPNRPFATETITGLMLPDGIFESSLGHQRINAHFRNVGAAPVASAQIYVEGVSDPSIVITPATCTLAELLAGGSRVMGWDIDVTATPPGVHLVSFIVEDANGLTRAIKKIFVTRVQFNQATKVFTAESPEGRVEMVLRDLIAPRGDCCGRRGKPSKRDPDVSFLDVVQRLYVSPDDPTFEFCPPGYLLHVVDAAITRTPPFAGQYGDYPFQDFAWKLLFCIIALVLLIAAAVDCAVQGNCDVGVTTGGGGGGGGGTSDCCGFQGTGGGSNYVAAGLVAAAATAATAAALSDGPDPIRRGQDNTVPAAGELTVQERLHFELDYPEPVTLGEPFNIGVKWEYTRVTTGASYTYEATDVQRNLHILSRYEITAPNVVRRYKREPWIIQGQFFGPDGQQFRGDDLLVQCLLVGPHGQYRRFLLQDDGIAPDEKADDGVYTGVYQFALEEDADGLWTFFVLAQDINTAQPDMTPEQQAAIVGGMVRTHQLSITIGGGTCPFVPDGDVNVIG